MTVFIYNVHIPAKWLEGSEQHRARERALLLGLRARFAINPVGLYVGSACGLCSTPDSPDLVDQDGFQ